MTNKEAIETIEANYPDERYTMPREALDMAIEPLEKQEQGWISVKDRMPDEKYSEITHDFEYCLCATTFGDVRPYKFGTPIGWKKPHFWHGSGLMDKYVTHWMPLPEPPKEG